MNPSPLAVRKLLVGLISLGCLITAAVSCYYTDWTNPLVAITMRLGVMLGALWLALPSEGDSIAWQKALPVVVAVMAAMAFLRINWRVLLYLLPVALVVAVVAAFIRPKQKRRP